MSEHLTRAEFERRAAWWNGLEERHRCAMLESPSVTPKTVHMCWLVFGPKGKPPRPRKRWKHPGPPFL